MENDYRKTAEFHRRFGFPRIYRLTVWLQWLLWRCGIPWHNRFSDECTPDFNCCRKPDEELRATIDKAVREAMERELKPGGLLNRR